MFLQRARFFHWKERERKIKKGAGEKRRRGGRGSRAQPSVSSSSGRVGARNGSDTDRVRQEGVARPGFLFPFFIQIVIALPVIKAMAVEEPGKWMMKSCTAAKYTEAGERPCFGEDGSREIQLHGR